MNPDEAIRLALADRREGATICPTEAARLLAGAAWRDALPEIHVAAKAMAAADEVRLTQRGKPVTTPRGAYRIGRV